MNHDNDNAAYHEAAHAVASALLDHVRTLPRVSIDQREHSERNRDFERPESFERRLEAGDLRIITDEIVAYFAGPEAERRLAGDLCDHEGADEDADRARDLALKVTGSVEECRAMLGWLRVRAETFVTTNWNAIERVAVDLSKRGLLSGMEVRRLVWSLARPACDNTKRQAK